MYQMLQEIVFIFSVFASSYLSYFLSHFLGFSKLLNYLSLNGEPQNPQNTCHEQLVLCWDQADDNTTIASLFRLNFL